MLTVRLHGHLEEKYGSEFKFAASTVREVIDALQANFDDFTEEFIKDMRTYNILVDAEAQEIGGCLLPLKSDSIIDIVPVIGGAGFLKTVGLIILAAVLIFRPELIVAFLPEALAAGGTFIVKAIGFSLLMAGVSSLLAGPDGPDGGGPESSSLSNTDNIIGQGMPIPVGYGRMMVGSIVLSATFTSSYTEVSKAWTYYDTDTETSKDHTLNIGPAEDIAGGTVKDDGYVVSNLISVPGYTAEQIAKIISVNEVNLGNGTYEVVAHTTSSGYTIATPVYKPVRIAGSYTGDAMINHR